MVAMLASPLWVVLGGLLIASAGTLALLGYTVANSDGDRTKQTFALLQASVFVWTTGQIGRMLATSLGGKVFWHNLLFLGIVATPVAWAGFTLCYTGRTRYVRRETVAIALLYPLVTLAVLSTNTVHHLFYRSMELTDIGATPVLTTAAGPFWWLNFGASYALILFSIVILLQFALRSESLYRIQTISITSAALVPLLANTIFVFELLPSATVDITPLAFALSTVLLFGAVFYGRFLDIAPVARDVVVQGFEDGVLVVDDDGRIVSANPAAAAMVSDTSAPETCVGESLADVEPTLAVTPEASVTDSHGVDRGFEVATVTDGQHEWFWVRRTDLSKSTAKRGTVLTLTNITTKKRFERQLRQLQRTHQRLLVAEDVDDIVTIAIESAQTVLDLPITGVWSYDDREHVLRPRGMTDEAHTLLDDQPVLDDGDLIWESFVSGELKRYADLQHRPSVHNPATPLRSEIHVPIGEWGVMLSGSTTRTSFEDVDLDLLRLLATAVQRALTRQEREQRIRRLHRRTLSLMGAESAGAVSQQAVETAEEVLGLSFSGIHLVAEDQSVLEATAVTPAVRDAFDEPPSYHRDDDDESASAVWDVFDSGETMVVDDIDETDWRPDSPVRSLLIHPLGEHGVFITSSPAPEAFDRTDRALAELFGTTVTAALDRVQREDELRDRERQLTRQNDRLEEFTSVVSHDLRSPLNQASILLDRAGAEHDDDRIDTAAEATARAEEMVEDLLALARQGKAVEDPERDQLASTIRDAWRAVPTGEASLELTTELGTIAADHPRLRQVFENLFRNAVEHNSPSGDGMEPLQVWVGRLEDETGIYVADTGPGIPADVREDIFDHGFTTEDAGTGFGLAIVQRIVDAHGWEIRCRQATGGGTRFEIFGMDSLDQP